MLFGVVYRYLFITLFVVQLILFVLPGNIRAQDNPSETNFSYDFPLAHVRDTLELQELIRQSREYRRAHPDSAVKLIRFVLDESRRLVWTRGIVGALVELGNLHQDNGEYANALNYFNLALAFAQAGQEYASLSTIYNNIGNAYGASGMYDASMQAMYKAVAYAEKYASTMSRSMIYTNLASKLRPEDGLFYMNKAEQLLVRDTNQAALGQFYINMGNILYELDGANLMESRGYFEKALRLGELYDLEKVLHGSLLNLGGWYVNMNKPDKAVIYLRRAASFHDDGRIGERDKEHALSLLASAYYQQGNVNEAERLLLDMLKRNTHMSLPTVKNVHSALSVVYQAKGDLELALKHKDMLLKVKDSLSRQENSKVVRLMEIRYRTAQKDKELTEKQLLIIKQKRNLETKNFWIMVTAAGASVLILLLIVVYRNYKHKQTVQENRIRILQQEQEIGHLKAMMKGEEKERVRIARELHDGIGGMLTAVKMNLGTARNQHPELTAVPVIDDVMKMLEETNEEVRKTAHNLMPDVLIKHGLEEALMIYCAHINAGGTLQIDLQFHGELDKLDKGVELFLYRISQELIQNVVKHAHADHAVVQIMQNDSRISITVEDNGIGFDPNTESKGFGLQNLQYRIHALEGILSIMSAKGKSTTIYMEFEMEKLILANS